MDKIALCVGINDYPGTDSDLQGAVNDCHDWESALAARGFGVQKLVNEQVTRAAFLAAFTDFVRFVKPGGTGVFCYSGHGTWMPDTSGDEPDSMDEALVPYDVATAGPVLDDALADILGAYRQPGSKIVLIFDCCHSGSVAKSGFNMGFGERRAKYLPPTKFLAELPAAAVAMGPRRKDMSSPGIISLAGCQDYELSYDTQFNGRPNGALTYFALLTLPGATTYRDWYRKIKKHLPHRKLPQTPMLTGTQACLEWPVL